MKRPEVEDFPLAEFLEVRMRMIYWLRLYGNDGEEMDFDAIAQTLSCDPVRAELIYMTAADK